MADDGSASRTGTRRAAAQTATRELIVSTAQQLFLENGYIATTIPVIAARSGVAVQTIYNAVGNKAALLSAVLDAMAAGPHAPLAVPDHVRAEVSAASDGPAVVRVLAGWFAEVNQRLAPLTVVIAQAAAVDVDAAALEREWRQRRLARYQQAASALRARDALEPAMSVEDAAAVIWSIGSPQTFRTLVVEHDWPIDRYRRWVDHTLSRALLDRPDPASRRKR
ncbi:TetR/AcrR family transcriptional regulator [Tersicoccus phoenicis]|uniref:TetR/AcrR family transcriptional regulator n=1 Tax=Tersicoccus phoenicis TaxID=554083 RepID=UPI0009FF49FF|nr:TetR/AcrR family transcriptional regulator [Tersicoccus phoenicis]